jgi:hypothetical protein
MSVRVRATLSITADVDVPDYMLRASGLYSRYHNRTRHDDVSDYLRAELLRQSDSQALGNYVRYDTLPDACGSIHQPDAIRPNP